MTEVQFAFPPTSRICPVDAAQYCTLLLQADSALYVDVRRRLSVSFNENKVEVEGFASYRLDDLRNGTALPPKVSALFTVGSSTMSTLLSESIGHTIASGTSTPTATPVKKVLGLERGTPFGTMGKGRGRCEDGTSLASGACMDIYSGRNLCSKHSGRNPEACMDIYSGRNLCSKHSGRNPEVCIEVGTVTESATHVDLDKLIRCQLMLPSLVRHFFQVAFSCIASIVGIKPFLTRPSSTFLALGAGPGVALNLPRGGSLLPSVASQIMITVGPIMMPLATSPVPSA
jgi:hypothetical protein